MKAIILAGGQGNKVWPYSTCHNKGMLKIGNMPILEHTVNSLEKACIEKITIGAVRNAREIKNYFRGNPLVEVIELSSSGGSGDTLYQLKEFINESTIVLFGDCLIMEEDIISFSLSAKEVLISRLHQSSTNQVCVEVEDGKVVQFWGHPRGGFTYFAAAFICQPSILSYIEYASDFFNQTKVGVGSPRELYLESAFNDYIRDKNILTTHLSEYQIIDIDKPWQIMEANRYYNLHKSRKVNGRTIGENVEISERSKISANVIINNNCKIGDNVVIGDGCVIGENTIIDNGANIGKAVHIGKNCIIENYCKIGDNSSIGDECIIGHTAEIIEAVLFDKVYLYHYGEYYGVIGTHSDLGAGTTCGTLRFDDGVTQHQVGRRKEAPQQYSNASFIGDYSRTGVNAVLLPGCKVGSKSVVGSGVILNEDVPDDTLIYPKQELCKVPWGDEKYGW